MENKNVKIFAAFLSVALGFILSDIYYSDITL